MVGERDHQRGRSASLVDGLLITASPVITSVEPSCGWAGSQVSLSVSIQQFVNTGNLLHLNLIRSGEQKIPGTVISVTPTGINCAFMIPADAKPGDWTLEVTNADESVATWPGSFMILSNPLITTTTPVSGVTDGQTVPFTLTGTRFLDHPGSWQ